MNIIIPMAGNGKRFADSGFILPKPLIPVAGKAMYRHAVDGLPLDMATRLIFVIRQDGYTQILMDDIRQNYAQYNPYIHVLAEVTRGQAETVLTCEPFINLTKATLVHNCDTQIGTDIDWQKILDDHADGCVVLFKSNQNRWSYAQLDETETYITHMREKEVISPYASSGTYYFKDTKQLMNDIRLIIHSDMREGNEYYLSTVYGYMMRQKAVIVPVVTNHLLCFGTPQDLTNALNYMITNELPEFVES